MGKRKRPAPNSASHQPTRERRMATEAETRPDWQSPCQNCGSVPTVPLTGLCGPCTFGEAETAGGDW